MTGTEAAYLAGIIDGEGYLGLMRRGNGYRARCIVANCNLRLLHYVRSLVGGCITEKPKRDGWSQGYNLRLSNPEAWLPDVIPYLVGKRIKAEAFLRALQLLKQRKKQTTGAGPMCLEELSDIYSALRKKEWL